MLRTRFCERFGIDAPIVAPRGGFLPDGRLTILYEAHIFHRETGGKNSAARDRRGKRLSSERWDKSLYGGVGAHQHERLEDAAAFDRAAALKARRLRHRGLHIA